MKTLTLTQPWASLVGPDAVLKLARIREALFDLAAGQLTGDACLQTIAQAVLSIEERAALHVPKVIWRSAGTR